MIPSQERAANGCNGFGLQVWPRVGHLGTRPKLETPDTDGQSGFSLFEAQESCPGSSSSLAALATFIEPRTVCPSVGPHPTPANSGTSISDHLTAERGNAPACVDVPFRPQIISKEDL